ncbi:hypothetical protein KIH31_04065 [Paenarthrobacter sp. DKR-5]|uniref:hypothetical protein n=1 Tax=Paenarthrobacter sp. DKR-5 TaxID=2835535 RepID=UPI001BDC55BC|nr:hypothetical protein [Paenarthrobacter sp. DKR-5]MBT1001770.1 hypothetical protein [Paenarthrobacter sp. DKR-5]
MPWWSWIVIWVALLALSAVYIGLLGWKVFRDFAATMRSLQEAGERFGSGMSFTGAAAEATKPRPQPQPAVFSEPEQVRQAYEEGKAARQTERRLRRVRRKAERGQPQSLRDLDLT